jgi:hypothetical protein
MVPNVDRILDLINVNSSNKMNHKDCGITECRGGLNYMKCSDSSNNKNHDTVDDINHMGYNKKNSDYRSILANRALSIDLIFEKLQGYVNHKSMNSLLNTSKKHQNVKKLRHYLELNKEHSLKYYREDVFRLKINMLLSNESKQLSLDLARRDAIEDVGVLGHIHSLDISYCRKLIDISSLQNLHKLDIRGCYKIINVTALHNCHTLILDQRQKKTIDISTLINLNVFYGRKGWNMTDTLHIS